MSAEKHDDKVWYDANCHCGRTSARLRIEPLYSSGGSSSPPTFVSNCNCSICTKNGYLNIIPEGGDDDIEWIKGKDELKRYQYGSGHVGHMFCTNCGSSFATFVDAGYVEGWAKKMTGINVGFCV